MQLGSAGPLLSMMLPFVFLLFVLSVPLWAFGAFGGELAPGLPVSALQALCPFIAAVILVRRERGAEEVGSLLRRAVTIPPRASKGWYLVALLLAPAISLSSYALLRTMGRHLPPASITPGLAAGLFLAFLVAGLAEEIGWSGYLVDRLQARGSALRTALLVGTVWAAWHWFPLIQAHRPAEWIFWWSVGTVASRVILVWLYNTTRASILATAILHATQNVCWQLFPSRGSHFDPRVNALLVVVVAAVVVALTGPDRLGREVR